MGSGQWQFGPDWSPFSRPPWLTLPWWFDHKRARTADPRGCRSIPLHGRSGRRREARNGSQCRRAGECPEWQRELTVNQPPHGFAGSSPASPTNDFNRLDQNITLSSFAGGPTGGHQNTEISACRRRSFVLLLSWPWCTPHVCQRLGRPRRASARRGRF
jgi:hypothetical protein